MARFLLIFVFLFATSSCATTESAKFGFVEVTINTKTIKVEYAKTFPQRAQGLMYQTILLEDSGMFFDFEETRKLSMWMKNTYIPLDVAYITKDGVIIDIFAMQPLTLNGHPSSKPARYALEMNRGWFAKHGIKVGDKVTFRELP